MEPKLNINHGSEWFVEAMKTSVEKTKHEVESAYWETERHSEALARLWERASSIEEALFWAYAYGRYTERVGVIGGLLGGSHGGDSREGAQVS